MPSGRKRSAADDELMQCVKRALGDDDVIATLVMTPASRYCNLFNFSKNKYYLEDDINKIITRNILSENEFSLMHLDNRSLPKNIGKLCDLLSLIDNKFTIIGVSETWLHSDNVDLYVIPEYTSIHVTRPSKKGGGVSLYVRSSLEYTVLSEMSIITEYLKCVFIDVNTRTMTQHKKIIVGIVYRPPSTNITTFTEHVMNIIDYLKVENKQCYILGDFNINLTNYGSHTKTQDYIYAIFQHSFIPLLNKPTRIRFRTRFRKGYSTEMATSVLIDNISKATDNREHVIVVFLDFAKTFDSVSHRILGGGN